MKIGHEEMKSLKNHLSMLGIQLNDIGYGESGFSIKVEPSSARKLEIKEEYHGEPEEMCRQIIGDTFASVCQIFRNYMEEMDIEDYKIKGDTLESLRIEFKTPKGKVIKSCLTGFLKRLKEQLPASSKVFSVNSVLPPEYGDNNNIPK